MCGTVVYYTYIPITSTIFFTYQNKKSYHNLLLLVQSIKYQVACIDRFMLRYLNHG
jgi:hypothetical protein